MVKHYIFDLEIILIFFFFKGLILVPNGEFLGYWFGDENEYYHESKVRNAYSHPWGIFFTILGTVLLDFDADACQSPARAYLLDVCVPEDHAKGLSTFTVMAGLGGFFGYSMSGLNWDETEIGMLLITYSFCSVFNLFLSRKEFRWSCKGCFFNNNSYFCHLRNCNPNQFF